MVGRAPSTRPTTAPWGRTVAVKVLSGVLGGETEEALDEARVQASVGWHANVLSVYGYGFTVDGWPYLVLEHAEGGSLRTRVQDRGPMSCSEVLRATAELAEALSVAHAAGVLHCDVKPSNVLFAADGSVRLADFGTALSAASQTLEFVEGSLVFAPPELLEGKRPTTANDVYGVAVSAHYALSGELPFGGLDQPAVTSIAPIHSEALDFSELGLPEGVWRLLSRCVAKDPAARRPCRRSLQRAEHPLLLPPRSQAPRALGRWHPSTFAPCCGTSSPAVEQ